MPSVGTISGKLVLNISQWDKGVKQSLATTKVFQRDVNKVFTATRTNIDTFQGSVHSLKAAFVQGKIGAVQYTAGMKLLREQLAATLPGMKAQTTAIGMYRADIRKLNTAIKAGVITMAQYRGALRNIKTAYVAANPAVVKLTMAMRAQAAAGKALVATGAAVRSSLLMYVGPLAAIYGTFKLFKMQENIEREMRGSLAIMRNVGSEMRGEMRRTAIQVASDTLSSTAEASAAYYFLASAGLTAAQSIKALPAVAQFAQAGLMDLSTATSLLMDSQAALGMKAKDPEKNLQNIVRISDMLVTATRLANATTQQFAEGLAGPLAGALRANNRSLSEGISLLALFAQRNIKGAEASDKAAILYRDLPRAIGANEKAFKAYGLTLIDINRNMKPMATMLKELTDTLSQMGDVERAVAFDTLGLTRGVRTIIQSMLEGEGELKDFKESLNAIDGATKEVAGNQMTEFQTGWQKLAASIANAGERLQWVNVILGKTMEIFAKEITPVDKKADFGFTGDAAEAFKKLAAQERSTYSPDILAISLKKAEFPGASGAEDKRIQKQFKQWQNIVRLNREREAATQTAEKGTTVTQQSIKDNQKLEDAITRSMKAVAAFRDKLQFDVDTEGMTALEKELKKLLDALPDTSKAWIEYGKAVDAAIAAQDRIDTTKAVSSAEALRNSLRFDLDTFDLSDLEKQLAQLKDAGVADDMLADIRKMGEELDAMKFGEDLAKQFETSDDKFKKLIDDLLQWKDIMGTLPGWDEKLFDKGMAGATKDALKGITDRDPSDFLTSTLEKGSAEAYREEIGGKQKNLELEVANKQLEQMKKQVEINRAGFQKLDKRIGEIAVMEGEE